MGTHRNCSWGLRVLFVDHDGKHFVGPDKILGGLNRARRFDPRTGQINYAPVEEVKQLRTKTLGSLKAGSAPAALPASSACDIEVYFARPAAAASIEVAVGRARIVALCYRSFTLYQIG